MKYRKKQVGVDAVVWTGHARDMFDFLTNYTKTNESMTSEESTFRIDLCNGGGSMGSLIIKTKEGDMLASIGDYVIKEPFPTGDRDFYPCKPDIFEMTYEEAFEPEDSGN